MSINKFDDIIIYDGIPLSQILKEIHQKSESKSATIKGLIDKLNSLIKDDSSAAILGPLVAKFMEVSVDNDDQLTKLATIAARALKDTGSDKGDVLLSEEDKETLLKVHKESKIVDMNKKAI